MVELLEQRNVLAAGFAEFVDPHPAAGNQFGIDVLPLATGNVVVTSPYDDAGGTDAGAVYLFNGRTGALISTLTGSHPNDHIGSGGIVGLATGNYVVSSPDWSGSGMDAGAVTFGDGRAGINGVIGPANSLVGSSMNDQVGLDDLADGLVGGVVKLPNGNYLIVSPHWDGDRGAVTFGDGKTGTSGVISVANSLVGATEGDAVGNAGITVLSNGNYLVSSPYWHNGSAANAGAVTFGDSTSGAAGEVSSSNSLVGSTAGDSVGGAATGFNPQSGVVTLTNGNYVVVSPFWDNGSISEAGAVTFGSGVSGVTGFVDNVNSLVGSSKGDHVGASVFVYPDPNGATAFLTVKALTNGNYVVGSQEWANGAAQVAGAATFGNGMTGVHGTISEMNSLVGTTEGDFIGEEVTALTNGNYVVASISWHNGGAPFAGAATWGDGTTGVSGIVSEANSLVGGESSDYVGGGNGITALSNGNYVVQSSGWGTCRGAVTFGNGATGIRGVVSEVNSLVGSSDCDYLGSGTITALANGNYVINSPNWSDGGVQRVGAVTFANGTTGISGTINSSNSLVGSNLNDRVGRAYALANGNYVVSSSNWSDNRGAVTFGDGNTGVTGVVSSANSLVGSTENDEVGGIFILENGDYAVWSPDWDSGSVSDVGAVTFACGAAGITGVVSAENSLIGSTQNDHIGIGLLPLANGNYVLLSPDWDNGSTVDAGAATFVNCTNGISGQINEANSLVGSSTNDHVGTRAFWFSTGNYIVISPSWTNGGLAAAGAITFGTGDVGVHGPISASNSVFGLQAAAGLKEAVDSVNKTFIGQFYLEGRVRVGSKIDGFAHHWHLAATPNDVNNDAHVAANDAVAVINYINAGFPSAVAADAALGGPYGFVDVNGDDFVAANDALDVINAINAGQGGEGEQAVQSPRSNVQGQETTLTAVDDALMMLLVMDMGQQAGKRRGRA